LAALTTAPCIICDFWQMPFLVGFVAILPANHNILAFERQIIARYGRQTLSKADIVAQRRIPLATAFKPDE